MLSAFLVRHLLALGLLKLLSGSRCHLRNDAAGKSQANPEKNRL